MVDDAVAFSGGLDLTIRRWDTSAHKLDNPHRVDPAGEPYPPFHDVQALVDGEAAQGAGRACARALVPGEEDDVERAVARRRSVAGQRRRRISRTCEIGISRTAAARTASSAIREVEKAVPRLDRSRRSACIYIENQFLTSEAIAAADCAAACAKTRRWKR